MLNWFKYGGPPEWVLGKIQRELDEEYHDRCKGGIIGYIDMIGEADGRQYEVIVDYPEWSDHEHPDSAKRLILRTKLLRSRHASTIEQTYEECERNHDSFDTFLWKIRDRIVYDLEMTVRLTTISSDAEYSFQAKPFYCGLLIQ
jgi:hypothetical protein